MAPGGLVGENLRLSSPTFFLFSIILILLEPALLDLSQPTTWSLLSAVLFCLIFQAWWIVPYTRIFPVEVQSAKDSDGHNTIGILTANVLTTNRNSETLIECNLNA